MIYHMRYTLIEYPVLLNVSCSLGYLLIPLAWPRFYKVSAGNSRGCQFLEKSEDHLPLPAHSSPAYTF